MGYPQTAQVFGRLNHQVGTVIFLVNLAVHLPHRFRREGSSLLDSLVNFQFKLGEHHLRIECPQNLVDVVIQKIKFLLSGLGMLNHVLNHNRFIAGGGNLGREQRMPGVNIRLILVSVVRMHGMPQFVRQSEDIVESAGVIHQDIRMHRVGSPGIGAASFPLCFENIDPAGIQRHFEVVEIFIPQRFQPVKKNFFRFLEIGKLHFGFRHQRHPHIVSVQSIQFQDFLAQGGIAMQRRQILIDRFYQVMKDIQRNIEFIQGALQAGFVLAGFGVVDVGVDRAAQGSAESIFVGKIGVVIGIAGFFADTPVGRFQKRAIALLGQIHLVAVFIGNGAVLDIGVIYHGEYLAETARDIARHRQKIFHLG